MFEIMGTIGSLIICISALPQIAKTYRTKKANDLSISYLMILMSGMTLMMIYSLHIGDLIFIFGNSLSVLSTGILIFLCLRYRNQFMTQVIGDIQK
jgi:MtN3 and saliva related transmembrane protein